MLNKFCQEWNPSGEYLRLEQRWAKYSSKKRILILFRKICNFILILECFLSKKICTYTVKYSHFSLKYQGGIHILCYGVFSHFWLPPPPCYTLLCFLKPPLYHNVTFGQPPPLPPSRTYWFKCHEGVIFCSFLFLFIKIFTI